MAKNGDTVYFDHNQYCVIEDIHDVVIWGIVMENSKIIMAFFVV